MNRLGHQSIQWLVRRLAARPRSAPDLAPGVPAALDGAASIAFAESAWCDTAAIGGTFPAASASRVWARLQAAGRRNAAGRPIGVVEAESAAGALAGAIGAACTGLRATAFLSGHDLAATSALLAQAAGRRVPLVVHVAARAMPARGLSFAGGHDSLFACADAGCGILFAITAQEAIDLALVARLASERSLIPFILASDALETVASIQDVHLPEPALVSTLLHPPARRIKPPTPSQRILFGEHRPTVPRWHDPDDPAMGAPVEPIAEAVAGAAASRVFFADHADAALREAFEAVGTRTGRAIEPVSCHRTKDARLVLVALGATSEIARAVTDHLRAEEKIRVGVVTIRQLRPWPCEQLAGALAGAQSVVALERADAPLAGDGPLARELRPCCPAGASLCRAVYGIGGAGPTIDDLAELCRQMAHALRPLVYLGVDFAPTRISPKRQPTIDAIARAYPGASKLALGQPPPTALAARPGTVRLSIARVAGEPDQPLATNAARLTHAILDARLRTRSDGAGPIAHGDLCVDRVEAGPGALLPDAGAPADILLVAGISLPRGARVAHLVRDAGVIVVPRQADSTAPCPLDAQDLRDASARKIRIIIAPFDPARAYEQPTPAWRRHEALLGALVGALGTIDGVHPIAAAKAARQREALFEQDGARNRAELVAAFSAALDRWSETNADALEPAHEASRTAAPDLLEKLGLSKHPVNDLPASWDRHASAGAPRPGVADPFAGVPVMPALGAALRPVHDPAGELVEFDPATCDGCARLWTSCPDGSVGAVAIGAADLLKTGIRLAADAGHPADALTPILSKLGARINKEALGTDRPPTTLREAAEPAFAWMLEKMAPPEDRRAALLEAFRAVMDAAGMLPIARTLAFFDEPEREQTGSGAFLVVGVNPDACKSARVAIGPCEGRGLRIVPRTEANLERARMLWRIFELLPDTPGATIERVASHPGVGALGAIMLAKSCAQAMAPGDASEAGSGTRLALRIVLGACEAEVQPHLQRLLEEIRTLRERLSSKIRELLIEALPGPDLDVLSDGLRSLGRDDVDLGALTAAISRAAEGPTIDAARLHRLIEPARALADLEWRLASGTTRLGRARSAIAIAPGAAILWAVTSPLNPFQGPVTVDGAGWTPDLARGLCEGHKSLAVEAARLVRWARAAIDGRAESHDTDLLSLTWADLDDAERAVCPPLLLVGDDVSLAAAQLGPLLWLLSSGLPVKVVLLTGAGGRPDASPSLDPLTPAPAAASTDPALLALLARRAYVARCSVAAGDHLAQSARRALAFDGPALLHVHAPSPQRHGFLPERLMRQAALCVQSRAHCLFRFDPGLAGVFGSCLDLTGNPDPLETFAANEHGQALTPLDWAITESRFRDEFEPSSSGAETLPASRFLGATREERAAKAPLVIDPLDKSAWVASPALVALADERLRLWRTLQELAGLVTPFTKRVREDAERAVAAAHRSEIAALEREHEAALGALRASFEADAVDRVRAGLMRLAGYAPPETAASENGSP